MMFAKLLRRSGARIDTERFCPELYQVQNDGSIREAVMDVVAVWLGLPALHLIDVTIHSLFYACSGNYV